MQIVSGSSFRPSMPQIRLKDMDQPAFRLHPLKGDLKGYWAVTVRANWRVVFQFADGKASNVDLTDYH